MDIKELETEDSKRKIATLVNSLINLNTSKTTIYIRIDDELVLDDYIINETDTPISFNNSNKYLKIEMPDIHMKDELINSHIECMGINQEEDETNYDFYFWWLFRRMTREELTFRIEDKIHEYNDI